MPTDQDHDPENTESLIAEPLCVRLGIDRTRAKAIAPTGQRGLSLTPEANAIETALQAICRRRENVTFMLHGRLHHILWAHEANPTKGTAIITRAGGRFGAQIVVAPVDEKAQHIYAEYHLVENGKFVDGEPRVFLECEGNPTTMMVGNNVLPVSFRDPKTRVIEPYPSSAHSALTKVNRELFFFLDTLARQVTGRKQSLFSAETRQAIFRGDFRIVHIQWCCYLRAEPSPFLRILVALFEPPAATRVGFSKLAEQLGLRFDYKTDLSCNGCPLRKAARR